MTVDRLAEGYQPDFDIDYSVGHQGELYVMSIIDALKDGRAEVKTDEMALVTNNVYFERECLYRSGWRPTGIDNPDLQPDTIWVHVVGSAVLGLPIDLLRRICDSPRAKSRECKRGDHPTRGVVFKIPEFAALLRKYQT